MSKILTSTPKTFAIAIFFLIASMIAGFHFIVLKFQSEIEQMQSFQIPFLERSAVAVRINQTLALKLKAFVLSPHRELKEEIIDEREVYHQNVAAIFNAYEKVFNKKGSGKEFNRKVAEEIEDQVLDFVKKGNIKQAQKLLNDKSYNFHVDAITDSIQLFTEQISLDLDNQVSNINQQLKYTIIVIVLGTISLVVLFSLFLHSYMKNLREKEYSEKLLEEQRLLAEQNSRFASLGQMAGGIAHEINSPLQIIRGNAEILVDLHQEDQINEVDAIRLLNKIISTSDRISAIIRAMMKLNRGENRQQNNSFLFNEMVRDSVSICREKFNSYGISLRVHFLKKDQAVKGSLGEVSQILINLLNNAFDAVENVEEKWIEINSKVKGKTICLQVIDSGPGIPEKVQEHILTPFFTTKEIGRGTGMGLSISSSLAKKNNGELRFLPQKSRTTFEISLTLKTGKEKISETKLSA